MNNLPISILPAYRSFLSGIHQLGQSAPSALESSEKATFLILISQDSFLTEMGRFIEKTDLHNNR